MTEFDLPPAHSQDTVEKLPVALGLAALESQILEESRPTHRWRTALSLAAAAAVVAGVGFAGWSLTRPADSTPTTVASDPTAVAEPTTATATATAAETRPTSIELPTWRPPARIMSLSSLPEGWVVYEFSGNGRDFTQFWRVQGQEKYFSIEYQNAEDYARYAWPDCCDPDGYSTVSQRQVLGQQANVRDQGTAQTAHFAARDDFGVRIESSGTTLAEFDGLVARLGWTDRAGLDATPGLVASTDLVAGSLDAVRRTEVPGGPLQVDAAGPQGRYSLDHAVLSAVTDAWVAEYVSAYRADDSARMDRVATSIRAVGHSQLARDAEMATEPFQDTLALAMRHRFTPREVHLLDAGMVGPGQEDEQRALHQRLASLRQE